MAYYIDYLHLKHEAIYLSIQIIIANLFIFFHKNVQYFFNKNL